MSGHYYNNRTNSQFLKDSYCLKDFKTKFLINIIYLHGSARNRFRSRIQRISVPVSVPDFKTSPGLGARSPGPGLRNPGDPVPDADPCLSGYSKFWKAKDNISQFHFKRAASYNDSLILLLTFLVKKILNKLILFGIYNGP